MYYTIPQIVTTVGSGPKDKSQGLHLVCHMDDSQQSKIFCCFPTCVSTGMDRKSSQHSNQCSNLKSTGTKLRVHLFCLKLSVPLRCLYGRRVPCGTSHKLGYSLDRIFAQLPLHGLFCSLFPIVLRAQTYKMPESATVYYLNTCQE